MGYTLSVEKAKRIAQSFDGKKIYTGDLFNDTIEVYLVMNPSGQAVYSIVKSTLPWHGLVK